ncbi:predicted protein [Postia placenta Mad-698-R]|nr:predicted protein [Postia placenta Mad-698-R]
MTGFASALAYSSDSAGMHPSHTLPLKLDAIAVAGFPQVEIGFPDLEAYAEQIFPGYIKLDEAGEGDLTKLVDVAGKVKGFCQELGYVGIEGNISPSFSGFEGYTDERKREQGLQRARAWFKVLNTGWRGPWSFEVFYEADMSRDDPEVPRKWTRSAQASFDMIVEKLQEKVGVRNSNDSFKTTSGGSVRPSHNQFFHIMPFATTPVLVVQISFFSPVMLRRCVLMGDGEPWRTVTARLECLSVALELATTFSNFEVLLK